MSESQMPEELFFVGYVKIKGKTKLIRARTNKPVKKRETENIKKRYCGFAKEQLGAEVAWLMQCTKDYYLETVGVTELIHG